MFLFMYGQILCKYYCSELVSAAHQNANNLQLSNLNTPKHKWNLLGLPDDVEIYIKRDDLTGTDLSGNKVSQSSIILERNS